MNFNKQKFFIALICTLMGWGVGYEMGKNKAEEEFSRQSGHFGLSQMFSLPLQHFFGEPIPEKRNPSLWERLFGKKNQEENDSDGSPLEDSFSIFGNNSGQPKVNTREDENNVYLEIDLESFDKNSLSARVEANAVIVECNHKSEDQGISMNSHFYQSFPVPGDTDASKVDMTHENNKLVLKFPKIKR